MNNIKQKNVVSGFKTNTGLPYQKVGNIKYQQQQNINFANINNSFQQLLDNDLYVENAIKSYASNNIGPKSNKYEDVYNGCNGYKVFDADGVNLNIYRKQEIPLNDSVSCIYENTDVNFVVFHGNTIICGTENGLYYQNSNNKFIQMLDHESFSYFKDDNDFLIATDNGIYKLVTNDGYSTITDYKIYKINITSIEKCKCVSIDRHNEKLLVGSDNGLYSGDLIYPIQENSVTLYECPIKIAQRRIQTSVNDINFKNTNILIGTNDGLFTDQNKMEFVGYKKLLDGIECIQQIAIGIDRFIGTKNALYKVDYDYTKIEKLKDINDIKCMYCHEGVLYIGSAEGIYKYDQNISLFNSEIKNVKSICFYDNNENQFMFVATDDSVYYFNNDSDFTKIITNSTQINDITINDKYQLLCGKINGLDIYNLKLGIQDIQSQKIQNYSQVYKNITEPRYNGLFESNGKLFGYGDNNVFGLDEPQKERSILDDYGNFKKVISVNVSDDDTKSYYILAITNNNLFVFENNRQAINTLCRIDFDKKIEDIFQTTHLIVVRTSDKSLYYYNKYRGINDSLTFENFIKSNEVNIDDAVPRKDTVAILKGTQATLFAEEQYPSKLEKHLDSYFVDIKTAKIFNTRDIIITVKKDAFIIYDSVNDKDFYTASNFEECNCVYIDGSRILIGTNKGVKQYYIVTVDDENNSLKCEYKDGYDFLVDYKVNDICKFKNTILYATSNGIYSDDNAVVVQHTGLNFNESTQILTRFEKIVDNEIQYWYLIKDKNGLSCFEDGNVENIVKLLDINDIQVYSTLDINNGVNNNQQVWIGTNGGLIKLDKYTNQIEHIYQIYNFKSIVQTHNFNTNNVYTHDAETIYITTDKGVQYTVQKDELGNFSEYENIEQISIIQNRIFIRSKAISSLGKNNIYVYNLDNDGKILKTYSFIIDKFQTAENMVGINDYLYILLADKRLVKIFYDNFETVNDIHDNVRSIEVKNNRIYVDAFIKYYIIDDKGNTEEKTGYQYCILNSDIPTRLEFNTNDENTTIDSFWCLDENTGYVIKTIQQNTGLYEIYQDDLRKKSINIYFPNKNVESLQYAFGVMFLQYNDCVFITVPKQVEDLRNLNANKEILHWSYANNKIIVEEDKNLIHVFNWKFKIVTTFTGYDYDSIIEGVKYKVVDKYTDITPTNIITNNEEINRYILGKDTGYNGKLILTTSGIYIDDDYNVILVRRGNTITNVSKIFGNDNEYLLQKKDGLYTSKELVNEQTKILEINGVKITYSVDDIRFENDQYFLKRSSDNKWYYYYHKQLLKLYDDVSINDIKGNNGNLYIAVDKTESDIIMMANYLMIRYLECSKINEIYDGYEIVKIYKTDGNNLIKIKDGYYYKLINPSDDYSDCIYTIGFRNVSLFDDVECVNEDSSVLYCKKDGILYRINESGSQNINEDIDIPNNINQCGNFTSFCSDNGLIVFNDYRNVTSFYPIDDIKVAFYRIVKDTNDNFIIGSGEGLYRYYTEFLYRISIQNNSTKAITTHNFKDEKMFVFADGNVIYESKNCKNNVEIINLSKFTPFQLEVNDICVKSRTDYYIATSNGLYKTIYSYDLINDFETRKEYEIQQFVETLDPDIEEIYNDNINKHINEYHKKDSIIDKINTECLSVNFEPFDDQWSTVKYNSNDEVIVKNDMVYQMKFGESSSDEFMVKTENSILTCDDAQATYILKKYISSINEIFINIPTTKTYYINDIAGIPNNSGTQTTAKSRKNLENNREVSKEKRTQNGIVSDQKTRITLSLNANIFQITDVFDIQINGTSLPLKVYKENISSTDLQANGIYHSLVVPSVVGDYNLNHDGYHVFVFYCFGTDEQNIAIRFSGSAISKKTVSIVYNSNNSITSKTYQQNAVIGENVTLMKNKFDVDNMQFTGWSATQKKIDESPDYGQEETITIPTTYNDGDVINLYATWSSYVMDSDSTIITLNPTTDELYINDGEIIPNGTYNNGVLIDYGS